MLTALELKFMQHRYFLSASTIMHVGPFLQIWYTCRNLGILKSDHKLTPLYAGSSEGMSPVLRALGQAAGKTLGGARRFVSHANSRIAILFFREGLNQEA
jgi:hypothetical protein